MKVIILSLLFIVSSCSDYAKVVSTGQKVETKKISWLTTNSDLNDVLESIDSEYNLDDSASFVAAERTDHDAIQAWFTAVAVAEDFATALTLSSSIPDLSAVNTLSRATFLYGFGKILEVAYGSTYSVGDINNAQTIVTQLLPQVTSEIPSVNNADISIVEEIARLLLWKSYFKVLQDPGGQYNALSMNFMALKASNVLSTFVGRANSSSALVLNARQYVGIEVIKASHNLSPLGNWVTDIAYLNTIFGNIDTLNTDSHVLLLTSALDSARDTKNTANGDLIHDWLVSGGTLGYMGTITLTP